MVEEEVRALLPGGRQRRLAFRCEPGGLLGTVQDISGYERAKARLERQLAQGSAEVAELGAVVELGQIALACSTARSLIGEALTTVVKTLGADHAGFFTYRAGDGTLVLEQSSPEVLAGHSVAIAKGPRLQSALAADGPVPIDASDCDHLLRSAGAGLWATVRADDEPYGAIVAAGAGAEDHHRQFLASVAGLCGAAIEREERDRRKSDFVATASHELKTPATSILGFLELLISGEAGQLTLDQHHMLESIDRNGKRLMSLIENLLTTARMESGTAALVIRPVEVAGLVDGAIKAVQTHLSAKPLELTVDVAPGLAPIAGDAEQLERVLINLLTNAIKYTLDGGRVSVRAVGRGEGAVEIVVEDTGVGIPEDELQRVFDRFFRASTAKDAAAPGTGLGMAIVKTIVDRHEGHIELRSKPGKGTAVIVELPLHGVQRAPAPPRPVQAPKPKRPAPNPTPMPAPAPAPAVDASPRAVVDALRLLLRAQTGEEVMAAVVDAIIRFGGTVAPPSSSGTGQLPLDVAFGVGDPLVPTGDDATIGVLAEVLPALVEDARVALERARVQRHLAQWASVDPVTSLANRRATMRELARLRLGDIVVKADLDHLRQADHLHGPGAGDAALRTFAQVLAGVTRPSDTAGRLDGGEFVLLLPRTGPGQAQEMVDQLRRSWAQVCPPGATFHAGIAVVGPAGPRDALGRAEDAAGAAKQEGLEVPCA